jgi:hypothetical protein
VLKEMKVIVSNFQGFSFCFARREANKAAHVSAHSAFSISTLDVIYELILGFLVEPVQSDLLPLME